MKLNSEEIQRVCRLVDEIAGIQWDDSKTYLIESRLPSLLKDYHCNDLTDLVAKVRSEAHPRLRADFIDAITTRETLFFRDESPFNAMKHKALPEIIDAKSGTPFARRLRLWSAACSSGQEPYSIGITLAEMLDDLDDWDIQILATDISPSALEMASKGVYSDFEMSRGVSTAIRDRYFHQVADGWKICDRIRSLVSFQSRNLLEPFTFMGPFDIIFCRNVAIYFDAPIKKDLFERLAGVLAPHGAILVGGSENLSGFGEKWKPMYHCRGIYYQPSRLAPPPVATRESGRPSHSTTVRPTAARPTAGSVPTRTVAAPAPSKPAAKPLATATKASGTATVPATRPVVGTPARSAATHAQAPVKPTTASAQTPVKPTSVPAKPALTLTKPPASPTKMTSTPAKPPVAPTRLSSVLAKPAVTPTKLSSTLTKPAMTATGTAVTKTPSTTAAKIGTTASTLKPHSVLTKSTLSRPATSLTASTKSSK